MSRRCEVSGKAVLVGNLVSHSNVKTKHRFLPNLRRFKIASQTTKQVFNLKISTTGLRIIERAEGLDDLVLKQKPEQLSARLNALRVFLKKQIKKQSKKQETAAVSPA